MSLPPSTDHSSSVENVQTVNIVSGPASELRLEQDDIFFLRGLQHAFATMSNANAASDLSNPISSTKRNMTILLAKGRTVQQPLRVQRMIMKMAKFPTQGQKTILRRQILTSIQNFEGEQIHNI